MCFQEDSAADFTNNVVPSELLHHSPTQVMLKLPHGLTPSALNCVFEILGLLIGQGHDEKKSFNSWKSYNNKHVYIRNNIIMAG